jgi:hypothetical protein
LYTPAIKRVRQAVCHHLYNYETFDYSSVSRDTLRRQLKPIEKLVLKLCNVAGIYSVSRIWADSDKKMRIYSSASIAENPLLAVRAFTLKQ